MSNSPYRLSETTPPGAEPLTLDEVKTFLRLDHSHDDAFVTGLIGVARQFCESKTGRSLVTRSYSLYLDRWPCTSGSAWWDGVREGASVAGEAEILPLPRPPLVSVMQVNVYAADHTSTVFPAANYYVDKAGCPGRIVLMQGVLPPVPGRVANGIEIQFKAGYGTTPQTIPVLLRQGMKQLIAHLYEHRGDSPEQALAVSGADSIFQSYRPVSLV